MPKVNCQSQQTVKFWGSAMSGKQAISIEVFQDLILTSRDGQRSTLRDALHRNAAPPWRHAEEKEREFPDMSREFLAFQRASGNDLAASGLTLCGRPDGYEVVNIVPLEDGELGVSGYNDVLKEYISNRVDREFPISHLPFRPGPSPIAGCCNVPRMECTIGAVRISRSARARRSRTRTSPMGKWVIAHGTSA